MIIIANLKKSIRVKASRPLVLKKSHCDGFNIVFILAEEEEFEEVDDDIIDEEFNEKESEEGNSMFYNLLCYYM